MALGRSGKPFAVGPIEQRKKRDHRKRVTDHVSGPRFRHVDSVVPRFQVIMPSRHSWKLGRVLEGGTDAPSNCWLAINIQAVGVKANFSIDIFDCLKHKLDDQSMHDVRGASVVDAPR